jgi:hypothetical protein
VGAILRRSEAARKAAETRRANLRFRADETPERAGRLRKRRGQPFPAAEAAATKDPRHDPRIAEHLRRRSERQGWKSIKGNRIDGEVAHIDVVEQVQAVDVDGLARLAATMFEKQQRAKGYTYCTVVLWVASFVPNNPAYQASHLRHWQSRVHQWHMWKHPVATTLIATPGDVRAAIEGALYAGGSRSIAEQAKYRDVMIVSASVETYDRFRDGHGDRPDLRAILAETDRRRGVGRRRRR